eukprot:5835299-Prymnesium_polylepis.1
MWDRSQGAGGVDRMVPNRKAGRGGCCHQHVDEGRKGCSVAVLVSTMERALRTGAHARCGPASLGLATAHACCVKWMPVLTTVLLHEGHVDDGGF